MLKHQRKREAYFQLTKRLEAPLDLYRHLPFQIAVVSNLMQLNRDQQIKQIASLEARELRVVLNIGSYMPISSADIAYQSRMDAYTISRAVKRLKKHDLIEFESDANNKKIKLLVLTEKGVSIYQALCLQIEQREEQIEAKLNQQEKRTLMTLLAKLEDSTEAMLAESALSELSETQSLNAEQKELVRWWNKSQGF